MRLRRAPPEKCRSAAKMKTKCSMFPEKGVWPCLNLPRAVPWVCGGLSQNAPGAREALFDGGRLPGVSRGAALAGRIPVSAVSHAEGMEDGPRPVALCGMSPPGVGDGWHRFRSIAVAARSLVPRDLVRHEPEERRERAGDPTSPRLGNLQDCMDVGYTSCGGPWCAPAGIG